MSLTPLVAVHMTAALTALLIGPVALWARLGAVQRPWLHRGFGYAWVTTMVATAVSAIFIRSTASLTWAGFSPIHLLIPLTLVNIFLAFRALALGRYDTHRRHMQYTYIGACGVAGVFTLVPGRYLGDLLWHGVLGLT